MLKVLQVRIQEQGRCRFKKGSGTWNMLGSIDQEEGSTDRDTDLQNLIKAQQSIMPGKWLGF